MILLPNKKSISLGIALLLCALALPEAARADTTSGLVGYWTLDGKDTPWTSATAATTKDRSGNGNTGTLTNMAQATSPVTGKIGQALKFDGVDDYVNTGITSNTNFSNTTFSVSAWFKTTSSATQIIVAKQNSSLGGWAVSLSGTVLSVVHKDGAGGNVLSRITSSSGLNDGRWHHVVFTMTTNTSSSSGQNIDIYLDGVLNQGSLTNTAASATIANAVYIGDRFATSFPWSGSIDEVRIYNRALSASDITQLYKQGASKFATSPTTSLTSGLVGYWTLDGKDTPWTSATAATTIDRSGNGNTGTLTNMYQATSTVAGKLGQGLSFDGVDDYIDAGASSSLKPSFPFSVSFWVKRAASGDAARITTGDTGGSGVYSGYMVYAQSDLLVQIGDNGADCTPGSRYTMVSSTAPVGIGGWYHVVVVFSGVHSFSAFVNGASVALSYSGGGANSMVYGAGSRLRMNSSYGCGTTIREKGSLDEVRIYNRALSATEVAQLYKQGASKYATSPTTSLTSGLVGYWTLDGKDTPWTSATAATTKDRSGNSNTGTLTNMSQATSPVIGKIGQGLFFDKISTYVQVANASSLQFSNGSSITISAWIKPNQVTAYGTILVKGRDTVDTEANYAIRQDVSGKRLDFYYNENGNSNWHVWSTTSNVIPAAGQWYHVVVTYTFGTGSTIVMYVNGASVTGSWTTGNGNSGPDVTTQVLTIGRKKNATPSAELFGGVIDDVRIYNRALSASEVTQLYKQGVSTFR